MPIERFGRDAELDNKIAGKVLRLSLAAFFPPEAQKGGFIVPMMIRASEPPMKRAALSGSNFWKLSCIFRHGNLHRYMFRGTDSIVFDVFKLIIDLK